MRQIDRLVMLLGAAALGLGVASAQMMQEKTAHPFIRTTADATVSAKPDEARLEIGVVTQAASAQSAAAENASQTASTVEALRHALGADAQIHTSGYSLSPNFTYPQGGGQPILKGYTASNSVAIITDDLKNLGKVIDAATKAGANNVHGIEFRLKNEEPVKAQALKQASQQARASADAIAASLGLHIQRVLSVEEGAPQIIRPMNAMAMSSARGAGTPIEAGNIQVQATVTLTVEVAP
jgi:uncharacterized protein